MTNGSTSSGYRIFVLSSGASFFDAKPEEIQKIAEILKVEGGIQVVYPLRHVMDNEEKLRAEIKRSVDMLVEFLRPVHGDFAVQSYFAVGYYKMHIHVVLESNVIRFTEAP